MERFWSKVKKTESCWEWKGAKSSTGYGNFSVKYKQHGAHRFAWELLRGPVPEGMTLDHICKNRGCVNPEHMEVVSRGENSRRGIAQRARVLKCRAGHWYTPENTYVTPSGDRRCRECAYKRDHGRSRSGSK